MDAVILAAGEGTRMGPLTHTRPKPMLAVAGKPILEWDLEALVKNSFKRAILIVGYKKGSIKKYFGKEFKGLKLEYLEQKEQLGTGHALSLVKKKIKEENFLVMNGDLVISEDLVKNFKKDFNKHKRNLVGLVEVENPSEFGIVSLKGKKVQKIVEKPRTSREKLANAGIYFFTKEIFEALEKIEKSTRAEYELTDAIKILIKSVQGVYGSKCLGQWIDVGRAWDLLDANEILLRKEKKAKIYGKKEKFTILKGKVRVGKNTLIKSGSYIEGPCWIGENCSSGPNCYIRPFSTIMDNCKVGNAVEIKNSIIMKNTNVGHLSYVGDSVIGENCNFGAGTKVANLKVDDGEVKVEVRKELVSSGRRKFGCIIGDGVKTGVNVSIMPGRSIYPGAWVEAGSVVWNTIMPAGEEELI